MICKTTDKKEIDRFIEGAVSYALSEKCTGNDICWCNRCRMGGGSLRIGGADHQRFMEEKNLWRDSEDNALNAMGLGTLTQPMTNPSERAAEAVCQAIVSEGSSYQTGTGKGMFELEVFGDEDEVVLRFDGFRNSFCGGNEVFQATKEGKWELVESTQPERGVWGTAEDIPKEEREVFCGSCGDLVPNNLLTFGQCPDCWEVQV
ncbi:hypothetical protein CL633_03670 [bacterium]|nr:hypothetical protein [bacterium]